jgi:hypothetical protein
MVGAELIVGYMFAWLVRKARRAGDRADGRADEAIDAGVDRLCELIAKRLHGDSSLQRLEQEANGGLPEPSERTARRVILAFDEILEQDAEFADTVHNLWANLGPGRTAPVQGSVAAGENIDIHAADGSIAAGVIYGGAHIAHPPDRSALTD